MHWNIGTFQCSNVECIGTLAITNKPMSQLYVYEHWPIPINQGLRWFIGTLVHPKPMFQWAPLANINQSNKLHEPMETNPINYMNRCKTNPINYINQWGWPLVLVEPMLWTMETLGQPNVPTFQWSCFMVYHWNIGTLERSNVPMFQWCIIKWHPLVHWNIGSTKINGHTHWFM